MSDRWEFAIDVGGTFTDCLAFSPAGKVLQHKLLSSGLTKGSVGPGSTRDTILDESRCGDPADFWVGHQLALVGDDSAARSDTRVVGFDSSKGCLTLEQPLHTAPTVGTSYELSSNLEAPVLGIRYLLGIAPSAEVPPIRLRLGTTRGTNALLTRQGARTALVTTRGFGDLLAIGYQDRPQLFELTIRKPQPLIAASIEINERVAADGTLLMPLDPHEVEQQLQALRNTGIEALAICLLHADLYPDHERQVAAIAARLGFAEVSRSSEVAPLPKVVARAETTVVNAYLNPVLGEYLQRLQQSLSGSEIRMMTSAGGLVAPQDFRGHESVLSGPAGGVVGFARKAQAAGFDRAIGFDMGGTSTDVSRFDGEFEFEYETRKAGARLVAPTLAIETVAAGGGSVCRFDGTKLTVGPDSAGAHPGPACYGRGGPLTVTDLNFYLGRIATRRFPFQLDPRAVELRLDKLAREVADATGERLSPEQLAEGLLRIANANMARAVRSVSIAQGADPTTYVMVAFGGAAAQHGCAVASELGIKNVLIPPEAGILSAYGIGHADMALSASQGLAYRLSEVSEALIIRTFDALAQGPVQQLRAAGCQPACIYTERALDLKYEGTDHALQVRYHDVDNLLEAFQLRHQRLFGYLQPERAIEVVAARVRIVGTADRTTPKSLPCTRVDVEPSAIARARFAGESLPTRVYDRDSLPVGGYIAGPAIIAGAHSTVVLEPGWQAEVLSGADLLLADQREAKAIATAAAPSAVILEIFNNLLAGVAEQMGHVLRRTAVSVNVKERLDYSCGVFTATGDLIANAPHVPVHLGAMGETVRAIVADRQVIHPGDVYVTNDPYRGGSHLPDVTVVTPVHDAKGRELRFFVACRAHHAEIGGIRPGSMPPNSQNLAEEGVLISNFALVDNGVSREKELRRLLSAPPYASRRVAENLADIRAQVAANQQGAHNLLALIANYSWPTVEAQIRGIQHTAERKVRLALASLHLEHSEFTDYLELGGGASVPICVSVSLHDDDGGPAATMDFAGTAPTVAGNLNANRAIVTAAVLYVLRLLVDEDIPLNEGALRAVEIVLPANCLLNPTAGESPASTPAVAAGNVETSQRIVDVILGALGIAGASQGTMNNLLFGDPSFGYYETIAGGSGATADGPGADAVQVHMTNTRSTDPEILERRLPVRLWEFAVRRGSGGAGKHRGGDGVVRQLEFLQPLQLSLITGRRGRHPPYGAQGGSAGLPGENVLIRADGTREPLPAICELEVVAGDQLVIKTPGGGGYQ